MTVLYIHLPTFFPRKGRFQVQKAATRDRARWKQPGPNRLSVDPDPSPALEFGGGLLFARDVSRTIRGRNLRGNVRGFTGWVRLSGLCMGGGNKKANMIAGTLGAYCLYVRPSPTFHASQHSKSKFHRAFRLERRRLRDQAREKPTRMKIKIIIKIKIKIKKSRVECCVRKTRQDGDYAFCRRPFATDGIKTSQGSSTEYIGE